MKGQHFLKGIVWLLVLSMALAGCGGGSKSGNNTGGGGNSGGGNNGGSPVVPPDVVAEFGLQGFAAVPTAEFPNGTTGGTGGEINYVATGKDLQAAINKAMAKNGGKPQIIYVQGEITEENTGAKQIDIKDVKNVSVIGIGKSAVFNGIGINISRASNIIVQNVTVHHNRIGQKDAICIQDGGSHIWIDHCELYNSLDVGKDYYDELLSAKGETEYITFSWNYLHDSWKTSLIGKSDSDLHDRKITYHHNLIERCNSRLPSYRGGTGHIYNNYYKDVLSTCINSRVGAKLLIENNYFENCKNPIGSWFSKVAGYWYQQGNIFDKCTTTVSMGSNDNEDVDDGPTVPVSDTTYSNTCERISLPYQYTLESAAQAKAGVLAGAGVGKISDPGVNPGGGESGPVAPGQLGNIPTQSISGTGSVSFDATLLATGSPAPSITAIVKQPDPTIATAVLTSGTVTLTGVNAGITEIVVKVENSAGSIEVTVPIRVVGADPLVPTVNGSVVVLNETFATATATNFWTAAYKAQPGGTPMYYATSEQMKKMSFANGQLTMDGGMFVIGQVDTSKTTTSGDTVGNGCFDLSKNWKIQIRVISATGSGKFQVMVDNNTTSGSSSMHGSKSRIYNGAASELNDTTITISSTDKGPFTANSFLCLRAESNVDIIIDQILVETWD